MEKGLEIIVTKAKVSKDGELELHPEDEANIQGEESVENFLEGKFGKHTHRSVDDGENMNEDIMWIIVSFDEFENVIGLSHYLEDFTESAEDTLYYYNDKYYLYVAFTQDVIDDEIQENIISQILEFANDSDVSIHLLEEYGKKIFEEDTFAQVRSYFSP